jgi:hypothetical protein
VRGFAFRYSAAARAGVVQQVGRVQPATAAAYSLALTALSCAISCRICRRNRATNCCTTSRSASPSAQRWLEFMTRLCYFSNLWLDNNRSTKERTKCLRKSSLLPPSAAPVASLLRGRRFGQPTI